MGLGFGRSALGLGLGAFGVTSGALATLHFNL